ncbi:MAG TPA: hypothetical protein VFD89_02955 [Clostridia bacterium]|nr:hypothetical protein [Clostridia bacterium]
MDRNYTIYILLTYSGTLPSKFIRMYTREPYSHVSIALDSDLRELYSFGRLKPSNPIIGGFVRENILYGTFGRFPETQCALYSLTINSYQYYRLKAELNKFLMSGKRYGYNFLGLLGVMVGVPIPRTYKYFCSQFVATLLTNSGIDFFQKHPALVSPMDFRMSSKLTLIYEGKLRAYGSLTPYGDVLSGV